MRQEAKKVQAKKTSLCLPVSVKSRFNFSRLLCASAAFVLSQASNSYAVDVDLQSVGAGTITVNTPNANTTNIYASHGSIGNFNQFGVAAGNTVNIDQDGASSATLFRVVGSNPSEIMGNLNAEGHLMLVNPNGVFFGANSRVDVAGLIASTADTTDADFLAGKVNLSIAGKPDASIINKGSITAADGGLVALVAPSVRNDGIIQANLGTVALASAETASVDFYGDNLYSFALGEEAKSANSGVSNSGIVSVGGGKVLMTAKVAKNVVDNVINNTGIVEATSAHVVGGTIVLDGGEGNVKVSGTLDASGKTGGSVTVTGEKIELAAANIKATGKNGGGTVKIGGDYQGGGTLPHAKNVTVDSASSIDVSATDAGNAGLAVVWSDEVTDFNGSITGTGGVNGGNGGLAEVSSKGQLGYNGNADLSAVDGEAGTLLLDPGNLYIGNFVGGVFGGDLFVNFAPIVATLNGGTNVISTAINNVSVLADIIWSGSGSYTINAGKTVVIEADIKSSFNGSDTQGAITINAGRHIQMGNADVSTVGGDINTTSQEFRMSDSTVKSTYGDVRIDNSAKFSSSAANVISGKSVYLRQNDSGFIQNAIDAVGPTGSGGAFLQLGDGLWYENIVMNQSNFTLNGNGMYNSYIVGDASATPVVEVANARNKVTISNLAVTNGEVGIATQNSSNVKLDGVRLYYNGTGFDVNNNTSTSVRNSLFYGNSVGINDVDSSYSSVKDSDFNYNNTAMNFDNTYGLTLKNNYVSDSEYGAVLTNVVGSPINGNIFEFVGTGILANGGNSLVINSNGFYDVNYGVVANNSTGLTVTNNVFDGSSPIMTAKLVCQSSSCSEEELGGSGSYAVHVVGGNNTAVNDNTIDNFVMGIGIEDSTGNTIRDNNITNTEDTAIYLNKGLNSLIAGNVINGASFGIYSLVNELVRISGNSVDDTFTGIYADKSRALEVLSNTVSNSFIGIDIVSSDNSVFNNNAVSDNSFGIFLDKSDDVVLNDNLFTNNGRGLTVVASDNLEMTGDEFNGNDIAIRLSNSDNARILEATINSDAGATGISMGNGSGGAVVRGLNITGGALGVLLDGAGTSMQFEDNTSVFTGQSQYFRLQNNAMFGETLDASAQIFDGTRASDFTPEQLEAAEFITTDVEDGIATIGDVFYTSFPAFQLITPDLLSQLTETPVFGLFSFAGLTITNDPGQTAPSFDVNALNLSLLAPAAGGSTPSVPSGLTPAQLGGLEPAAGGNNPQSLAALEPAAGGEANCGNSFLGTGFSTNFNAATCATTQQ